MSPALRPLARRLVRRVASVLCLLSLILCLTACWLWARSRASDPYVAWLARADRVYQVQSRDGRLSVVQIDGPRAGTTPAPDLNVRMATYERSFRAQLALRALPPPVKSQFAGVEVERGALQSLQGLELEVPLESRTSRLIARRQNLQRIHALEVLTLRNSGQSSPVTLSDPEVSFNALYGVMSLPPPPAVRVTVPYRVIVAMTALLPAAWLGAWARGVRSARRTKRRQRCGLCPACGYDLRGSPAASRCPECGHPVCANPPSPCV